MTSFERIRNYKHLKKLSEQLKKQDKEKQEKLKESLPNNNGGSLPVNYDELFDNDYNR